MASSFGPLPFQTVRTGSVLPMENVPLERARQHVPASNVNVIDIGGRREKTIVRRIMVLSSDVNNWLNPAVSEQVWTLTLLDVDYGDCLLLQLSEHEAEIAGEFDYFTAEWLVIS